MRVLLADDQPEVRSALRLLLEQQPGLDVVGEASEAGDVSAQVQRFNPDVVLLDWELPGPGSAELPAALRSLCPRLLIVALSGRPEAEAAALATGVDAFVSKGDPPESLLTTLRRLAAMGSHGA